MRGSKFIVMATASLFFVVGAADTQQNQIPDSEYVKQALSAAPEGVSKGAAVVRANQDGSMRTLRAGTNGFTCMIMGTDKMCNDRNSMEFMQAVMNHKPPADKVGISYMLTGDQGASNTDPYAMSKTSTNHWVVTGAHIMVIGPPSKALGYTEAPDPDPAKPYMMWAGTPY